MSSALREFLPPLSEGRGGTYSLARPPVSRCSSIEPTLRHAIGSIGIPPWCTLDDILLSHCAHQADNAFGFQLPYHGDDLLLARLYFLDLHRTQGFHVFLQHLGAALRHA